MSNNTPDYEDNLYFDSQNTKKDLTSEQLTEQRKKGELPDGEYWCLSICDDIDKLYCYQNSFWKYKTEDDYYGLPVEIKQVLAPAPSYDELQNMNKAVNECMAANIKLVEQNAQLKELLKECLEVLKMVQGETIYFANSVDECVDKINQVLGEE